MNHKTPEHMHSTPFSGLIMKMAIFLILLFWLPNRLEAQDENSTATEIRPKVELIARPLKDSILVRWAPNNSLLWEDANKYGYMLERITLIRDGQLLSAPERKRLTQTPIMPLPLIVWERAVKSNKYAAIAAQALYGETFEMAKKSAADLYSVITKVKERDTR